MTQIAVMQDIMDNEEEKMLWELGRIFNVLPTSSLAKVGDTRLARALRLCTDEKITPE